MLKKLHIKWYFILVILIVLPSMIWASIVLFSEKPPVEKLENCRKLLAKARGNEAEKYSPKELQKAEHLWNDAMTEWKQQNAKSKAFRSYGKVSKLTDEAIESAEVSIENAVHKKESLYAELKKSLLSLKNISTQIEMLCHKLPLNHGIRENLTPAVLKLSEAQGAFDRNDLLVAKNKVDAVKPTIENLQKLTNETLKKYFEDYKSWIKLNEEMIEWSKKNKSVSLVVDKFSRKCYVFKSGKKVQE